MQSQSADRQRSFAGWQSTCYTLCGFRPNSRKIAPSQSPGAQDKACRTSFAVPVSETLGEPISQTITLCRLPMCTTLLLQSARRAPKTARCFQAVKYHQTGALGDSKCGAAVALHARRIQLKTRQLHTTCRGRACSSLTSSLRAVRGWLCYLNEGRSSGARSSVGRATHF